MKNFVGLLLVSLLFSCGKLNDASIQDAESVSDVAQTEECYVEKQTTDSLIILIPKYSRIDLVCGEMPSQSDSNVILTAEAAYTGECLKEFKHSNIAGHHVSNGELYKGYKCKSNTGAFVYYNDTWKFLYEEYYSELVKAEESEDGMGFGQEMIIHNGKRKETVRPCKDTNVYRALCEINNRLCIVESKNRIPFGKFCKLLVKAGATNAIYLDMGVGWNHAWYRPSANELIELHPKKHSYCTNWITFYK